MLSCQLAPVTVVMLGLMVTLCSAKTTARPKYSYTKKPVRELPPTTMGWHTSAVKVVPPTAHPTTQHTTTETTTAPSDMAADYGLGGTAATGGGQENYTLDYNECYFNFCECCPPEKGPRGLKGERGLPGKGISLLFPSADSYSYSSCIFPQFQLWPHVLDALFSSGPAGERGELGPRGPPGPSGVSGPVGPKGDRGIV